ncbi:MAG: hypothetical protein ACK4UY_04165 [Dietzia sp.]
MPDEIDFALQGVDETLAMIDGPLLSKERQSATQLVMFVEALLQAIRAGTVEASPEQVARLEMGQAGLRVAMDPR